MQRHITAFHCDTEGDWVARLDCGHCQHMRDAPPFVNRPWVNDAQSRDAMIGESLACPACDRLEIPADFERYSETKLFDQHSLPAALQKRHTTRPGVWGKIEIHSGTVVYTLLDPLSREIQLSAGQDAGIPPDLPHFVTPRGPALLRVAFFRLLAT